METVNDTAMHVTETKTLCSSLTCPKSKIEEITKEKEEELLYGNSDDGDEEDALSDDSIRLRVSDDEADLDEPSASKNLSNEKTEPESTNMELGSAVTAKDISEQKSALRREGLSNGKFTIDENKKSSVKQEDEVSSDDFASRTLPITENFYDVADRADRADRANYLNGDSGETDKKRYPVFGGPRTRKQGYRNPMIDYFRRTNRNFLSRPPHSQANRFVTNSYNNRYYNRNSHYGGGKGSGRGYNAYFRESFGNDGTSDGKYSRRVFQSDDSKKEAENSEKTDVSRMKIKTEDTSDNQAVSNIGEFGSTVANDVARTEINDSTDDREANREGKKEFFKNDNAEAALDSVDSTDATSGNIRAGTAAIRDDCTVDTSLKDESNQINVKSEVENSNVSVASDDTLIADDANDIAENFNEEERDKVSTEIEMKFWEEEPKVSTNESANEARQVDRGVEKIAENVATDKMEECTTGETTTVTETSDVRKVANADSETTEMKTEAVVGSTEAASNEADEVESNAQIRTSDVHEEDENKVIEESSSVPSEPRQLVSSSEQTEKSDEQSTVVAQSEPEGVAEQLTEVKLEQAVEDSPSVAMEESKTAERTVDSADTDISTGPKILEIENSIAELPDEKETSSDEEGEGNNVTVVHCSLKRMSTELLDEMELSKRMRIQRKKLNDSSECSASKVNDVELVSPNENIAIDEKTERDDGSVVNPVTKSIADIKLDLEVETSIISNTVVETSSTSPKAEQEKLTERGESIDGDDDKAKIDDCVVIELPSKRTQKRIRRSLQNLQETVVSQEDTQEKENVRQKRQTAKNAEEIIRKEFLGNSDTDSNDSAGKFVAVNYNKTNNDSRAASPPTLKRNHIEEDDKIEPKLVKKLKQDFEINGDVAKNEPITREDKLQTLRHVRQFFRRDDNGGLAKLKQEELEELLIQKVVETITMRDEIGKLREQAKISERNQEATRVRCQQLAKQIKDFEMVLNRYHSDRRSNPDKTVVPIKINRSVGLQVNFVTDRGIQNLRQLEKAQNTATPTVNGISPPQRTEQSPNANPIVKRTVKIQSPRRPDPVTPAAPTAVPSPVHSQPIITNITPAALVVAKSVQDTRPSVTTTVQQTSVSQLMASSQTILVNGLTNTSVRQTTIHISKTKNNSDLIDLTQEEEKTKTTVIPQNAILTTSLTEASPNVTNVSNIPQRYHTVIQTIPGSVAITAPSGIRVVQPSSQPTPTALVNNMNAPRLAYVVQGGIGGPRQVVITSTPSPIRPAPDHQNRPIRAAFPISGTITNGTVRVIPTSTTATLQVCKHPAALPEPINPLSNPSWKLPPPAPSLKISKVANGIVLSWNMALSDKFADIASYQLYAYQEVSGIAPSSTLWKKVGDVRALPLPMACTLTQFSEGNNYYFAVRAVDRHSRLGQYSQPGNISL